MINWINCNDMKNLMFFSLLMGIVVWSSCDVVMSPCPNKDKFLSSFEELLNTYQSQSEFTEVEKEAFDEQYRDLVNNCYKKYKSELTLKERQDFWVKSLKHLLKRYDGELEINLKDKMDDPFNKYVKDEVTAVLKESGLSFMMSLQEVFKDDLPKLMDTFSEEIKNIGQDFMNNLFKK